MIGHGFLPLTMPMTTSGNAPIEALECGNSVIHQTVISLNPDSRDDLLYNGAKW